MRVRLSTLFVVIAGAAASTACVFAPPSSQRGADTSQIGKMGEQAVATCGPGQVKEVNATSFSCK